MRSLLDYFNNPDNMYRWYRHEIIEKFEELDPASRPLAVAILSTFHSAETIIYRDDIYNRLKQLEHVTLAKE